MANILIVDDRPLNREFLVMLLGYKNHHFLEAKDGAEALKIAQHEPLNLIITDILMPTMDGYELVEQLHKIPTLKNIPIIFYTATYHSEEAKALAESCGVRFVLTKPAEPQLILDTVQQALNETQAESKIPIKALRLMTSEQEPIDSNKVNYKLSKNLSEIESIKQNFKNFIEASRISKKKHDGLIENDKDNSKNLEQLQKFSGQLVTIIELNADLITETDPKKLLHLFCKRARRSLMTKYSVLGILNKKNKNLKCFLTSGMSTKDQLKIGLPRNFDHGAIHKILKNIPINSSNISKAELFTHHPSITNFLGFPIATKSHVYGFFYFADKIDGTIFGEDDYQLAHALVSELSILYENFELYDSLQRHATKLQLAITERKRAQEELESNTLFFAQFAENLEAVFWRMSPKLDKMIYVSPAYTTIWGRPIDGVFANPHAWFESITPEDQPRVKEVYDKLIKDEVQKVGVEFNIIRPDGTIRNIYSQGFQLRDEHGKIINLLGIASDITEYQKFRKYSLLQASIANILKKYVNINEIIPQVIESICNILNFDIGVMWMLDPSKEILRCIDVRSNNILEIKSFEKQIFEKYFKKGEDLPGIVWKTNKSVWVPDISKASNFPRATQAIEAGLHSAFASPMFYSHTICGVVEFFSSNIQDINPEVMSLIESILIQLGEISQNENSKEKLLYLSQHDVLTDLLNRTAFEEQLKKHVMTTSSPLMGLIILGIDRFQLINEAMDQEAGDLLLQAVAGKIRKNMLDRGCLCARFGGDKFALALLDVQSIEQIHNEVINLNKVLQEPFTINNKDIFLTVSMGISIYPEDGEAISLLLQKAVTTLQQVKEEGGNHYQFSTLNMTVLPSERLSYEMDLRKAIIEKQFCLYYQPKVDLKTGYISGCEALIRWQHPEKGLISPASFIQIAEETGLIIPIGEWIFSEACRQIKNGDLSTSLTLALNVSMSQITQRYNFIDYIQKQIHDFDIDPTKIEIEITESILAKDVKFSFYFLTKIRKLGIKISLDDFGTGYSSLKYFQKFSIDAIKIDKSFVDGVPHNHQNVAIVKAIIALSHGFNIKVIAEGVETKEQLDCLIKEGCDEIQGYYFSKPLPADQIKKMISEKKRLIFPS